MSNSRGKPHSPHPAPHLLVKSRAFNEHPYPIIVVNLAGEIVDFNKAALRASPNQCVECLLPRDYSPRPGQANVTTRTLSSNVDERRFDWIVRLDQLAEKIYLFGTDVTEWAEKVAHATSRAERDDLTGLPNRPVFMRKLKQSLKRQRGDLLPIAVMYLDLDFYSWVNNLFGHPAGDTVLQEVAERLQIAVRHDLVARTGGEEFGAILEYFRALTVQDIRESLHKLYRAIQLALEKPIILDLRNEREFRAIAQKLEQFPDPPISYLFESNKPRLEIYLTISAGAAIATPGISSRDLIAHADVALNESKANGKNQLTIS